MSGLKYSNLFCVACCEIMNCLNNLLRYICIFIALFAGCMSKNTKKSEFVKYNSTVLDSDILACVRIATWSTIGCRINVHNMSRELMWPCEWCYNRTMNSDYIYMEKKTITVISPKWSSWSESWSYQWTVPVCMNPGATIEFSVTPRVDWTRVVVQLSNREDAKPLYMSISKHQTAQFYSKVNSTKYNIVETVGFPIRTDIACVVKIEILQYYFKIYANGIIYRKHDVDTSVINDVRPLVIKIIFKGAPGDINYVKASKEETSSNK